MRSPFARLSAMASRIILTASSASLATSCGNCAARRSISSDLVITASASLVGFVVHLGAKKRAQVGGARGRSGVVRLRRLDGLGFLGVVLRLDRQIDRAVLAVDVDDHRVDLVAF